jgi:hypothetical protein
LFFSRKKPSVEIENQKQEEMGKEKNIRSTSGVSFQQHEFAPEGYVCP